MQVDGHIETFLPQAAGEREVVPYPREAARPFDDHHVVQVRVVPDDGRGRRFDEVGELGLRIVAGQRADDGRREDDVANEAQPDQQDAAGAQGSTVASSMSITGMSSLIGYTR